MVILRFLFTNMLLRSRLQSIFYDVVIETAYAPFLDCFPEMFHRHIYTLPGERLWQVKHWIHYSISQLITVIIDTSA